MTQKKTFHKSFLDTVAELCSGVAITDEQFRIIKAEAKWVKTYLASKRRASASRTSYGRPAMPDDQVTATSLKKREYRRRKSAGII